MSNPRTDDDIEHIAHGLIEPTLPKSAWTHAAHFAAALWLLRLARSWLADRPHMALHAALTELLASPHGRSDWPLAYWSRERLFSVIARRAWVDPDLQAFKY